MVLSKVTLAIILAIFEPASAQANQRAWAKKACARVDAVYSACGRKFDYQQDHFIFDNRIAIGAVPCHDGRNFSFHDRLSWMDVASIFLLPYKTGPIPLPETRKNHDPGRLRVEEILKSVYGSTEAEVRANLVPTAFLGQTIQFQKQLGASAALERVSRQLLLAAEKDPSLATFLKPFTSAAVDLRFYAFAWRNVAGTQRLSTHSFGTGLDLNTERGPQYWLWDEKRLNPAKAALGEDAYRDDHYIPTGKPIFHPKAVDIFEKNGFIWGGKWNHYDTMHFEYRPEFIPGVKIDCPR